MAIRNKEYYIKVYRPGLAGAFISSISDFDWTNFRMQINTGQGDFTFKIPKMFDAFREKDLIAHNNQVKLYCTDVDSGPDGVVVYSGWIYAIELQLKGGEENVLVHCYGDATKLARSILRNGTGVILTTNGSGGLAVGGVAAANTVEATFKAIVDRYQAEATNPIINYTATSVGTTGNSATYTFDKLTFLDALNVCQQAAPAGWYWFSGADNVVNLSAKPVSATHTFVMGRHFEQIDVYKNTELVVNNLLIHNGGSGTILYRYQDMASQALYDDRWDVKTDTNVKDAATADNFGHQILNSSSAVKIRTKLTVSDNNQDPSTGYDIELIKPGDTVNIRGLNDFSSQTFQDNLQVLSVTYYGDKAELELEEFDDNLSRKAVQIDKKAQQALGTNGVTSYTARV